MKRLHIGASLAISLLNLATFVKANDIYIGARGPTEWQIDARLGISEKTDSKGATTTTFTQNDVLKYWNTMIKKDKGEAGVWAFANIPAYKSIDNGVSYNSGFGDFTLGAGPRGSMSLGKGSLHGLAFGGAVFPTGAMETGKLSLSGDRTDVFAGGFLTYFLDSKRKFEADLTVQYTFAGKNSKGTSGQNTLSGGLILGGRIFENKNLEIRLAGGINGTLKETGDYACGPRAVIRATPKLKNGKRPIHFEILGDYDSSAKNMPQGYSLLGQIRYNF